MRFWEEEQVEISLIGGGEPPLCRRTYAITGGAPRYAFYRTDRYFSDW